MTHESDKEWWDVRDEKWWQGLTDEKRDALDEWFKKRQFVSKIGNDGIVMLAMANYTVDTNDLICPACDSLKIDGYKSHMGVDGTTDNGVSEGWNSRCCDCGECFPEYTIQPFYYI